MTKLTNIRKQLILMATIGAIFMVPLLTAAQAQARTAYCSRGTLVSWDRGVPPDYNHDAKVCRIFDPYLPTCGFGRAGCYFYTDDSFLKK